jgi:hypothetical protein
MQITASNDPVRARRAAVSGISNEPGTRTTVTFSSATCASASARRAPASSPSVISALKRETTIANRQAPAL